MHMKANKHSLPEWRRAFTLIELLVVIIIIALLAALLLPVLAKGKKAAQKSECLSNFKQLQLCWQLYADDYKGGVPTNDVSDSSEAWVTGNMKTAAGATNLGDIRTGVLFVYNKSTAIYHCPSAQGMSPLPQSGLDASKLVRTVSMTPRFGNYTDHDGLIDPSLPFRKVSDVTSNPGPSQASVFVDESVATVDDSFLAIDNNHSPTAVDPFGFQNSPTIRHNGTGVFSYADGHAGVISFPHITSEPFPGTIVPAQESDWLSVYLTIYPPP
jgi:prepilin-type N-terminal cleavage/methylation domain-containing protein/prepilin-type processing-associated H-X9-DG protein